MKKLFLTAIILIVCNIATAETITGTVTRVSDGDTLTVKTDKRKSYTIRLARIDAPEISHYGVALNKRSQSPTLFSQKPLFLWLKGT